MGQAPTLCPGAVHPPDRSSTLLLDGVVCHPMFASGRLCPFSSSSSSRLARGGDGSVSDVATPLGKVRAAASRHFLSAVLLCTACTKQSRWSQCWGASASASLWRSAQFHPSE
mmetsp:Transcript_30792/g.94383  ORF Transcript_30792/g.94383 Transcript_30792/m.94383 type:complete len:113 (-) Transcript_30792:45-383(-)